MAYSLKALKDLLKNSPTVKTLSEKMQLQFSHLLKKPNLAERRRVYFILLQENKMVESINKKFTQKVEGIIDEYQKSLKYLVKK